MRYAFHLCCLKWPKRWFWVAVFFGTPKTARVTGVIWRCRVGNPYCAPAGCHYQGVICVCVCVSENHFFQLASNHPSQNAAIYIAITCYCDFLVQRVWLRPPKITLDRCQKKGSRWPVLVCLIVFVLFVVVGLFGRILDGRTFLTPFHGFHNNEFFRSKHCWKSPSEWRFQIRQITYFYRSIFQQCFLTQKMVNEICINEY